jgi:NitT/TauT family transport system ATP-binding protein
MARLDVERLTVDYTMRRTGETLTAVHEISFAVASGEFVAIVGPSGCGKTTILNAVAGIISWQSGRILIDNELIRGPGRNRAMVFQSPALFPWRTVTGNVNYGLELHGWPRSEAQARVRTCIDLVGLQGFEDSFPAELSGGMQQRANLARALAVRPEVLLFDEPLSALDAQTREYMQAELQRIWLQEQTTAVYVTHSISEAVFLADRVLVMSDTPGRIKAVVDIPFERPRPLKLRRTAAFVEMESQIWDLLDVAAGFSQTGA